MKIKYSREKITRDSDADPRSLDRADTETSAVPSSTSQSLLLNTAEKNRYSLPPSVPGRSASIAYETLAIYSTSSSTAPQLDPLADISFDGLNRSSTFRDGLEKAVDDINTKYGAAANKYTPSASQTSSVAIRTKTTFKPRGMVPIHIDKPHPNVRPVIGELWTALKSQEEIVSKGVENLQAISNELKETMSPFHDSHEVENECSDSESADEEDETSDQEAKAAQNNDKTATNKSPVAQHDAHVHTSQSSDHGSRSDAAVGDSDIEEEYVSVHEPAASQAGEHPSDEAESDGSKASGITAVSEPPQNVAIRTIGSSAQFQEPYKQPDLEETPPTSKASQARNSSAPSVAALVSKFRLMEQRPVPDQNEDGPEEQDELSLESNSRFIQSYRERSEDSDNEESLLSTVSGEHTPRKFLAVY